MTNPYRSPISSVETKTSTEATPSREQVRKKIRRACKIMGVIWFVPGVMIVGVSVLLTAWELLMSDMNSIDKATIAIAGFAMVLVGLTSAVVGWGLYNQRPWSRVPTLLACVFGLGGFPFLTLVCGYLIWMLTKPEAFELFHGRQEN